MQSVTHDNAIEIGMSSLFYSFVTGRARGHSKRHTEPTVISESPRCREPARRAKAEADGEQIERGGVGDDLRASGQQGPGSRLRCVGDPSVRGVDEDRSKESICVQGPGSQAAVYQRDGHAVLHRRGPGAAAGSRRRLVAPRWKSALCGSPADVKIPGAPARPARRPRARPQGQHGRGKLSPGQPRISSEDADDAIE